MMVNRNAFRSDLYYRINVVPIVIPPLRERREDIPHLLRLFLERYAPGKQTTVSPEVEQTLVDQDPYIDDHYNPYSSPEAL